MNVTRQTVDVHSTYNDNDNDISHTVGDNKGKSIVTLEMILRAIT